MDTASDKQETVLPRVISCASPVGMAAVKEGKSRDVLEAAVRSDPLSDQLCTGFSVIAA